MVEKVMPKKNKTLSKERFNTDNICFTFFTRNKEDALESGLFSLDSLLTLPVPIDTGFWHVSGSVSLDQGLALTGRKEGDRKGSQSVETPLSVCPPMALFTL